MYSNSSASSADPEQIRRRVAAQGQRAVDDVLREKEEEESGAPGAPPKVHEGRRGAGLSEEGGMDIDNAEDTWSSRGQKRKREMSGDILARHSQPKLRRVEVSDEQGPPLSCKVAAADGDADPLRIVITGEFNIDTINEWECTALEIAALGGSAEAIGLLLKEGAQIGQVNNQGRTPLHMAAGNGQTETIGLLLKEGAQIGQVDNDGNTPLHLKTHACPIQVDNLPLQVCSQIFLISPKLTPLFIDPDRIVSANWPDADHVFLVNALDLAILKKDAGAAELLLAHGARHSSFLRTDKFPFPIHDLLLCGPVNAPIDPAVTPEMMDMLISVFEASATGNMAEEEIAVVLAAAGLLSPLVEELAGQLCYGPQLKQAMAGSAPLTQAQIRQAVSGMLGELESYKISRPQPYRVPERRTVLAPDRLRTSTLVPWLSEEGQAHLTRSLDKQVQLLADLGRQTESDELGEGVWNLLDLCLQHLPVRSAANAAALRQALTGGLGLYGSLADKVLLAWLATLAELPAAGSAQTEAEQTEAERILLGTFAHQLQAQLKGAVLYPQMRTTSAVNQMTMHVTTQLMIRQWTMLEQYWHGAAVAAAPAPSQ